MDSGKYIDFKRDEHNIFYTFQFEGDEISFDLYNARYISSGDSDSCYISLTKDINKKVSIEQGIEIADEVCDRVNESYPDFLEKVFNCPPERNDSMLSEREVVADKTFILTKKRYIMHVVNDEGEPCDKLKIMGVEIKKSDTSKIVKDILLDLVKRILDDATRPQLKEAIKKWKKTFFSSDMKYIGKPSGCKKLKDAYTQLEETGNLKGVHYVARAAIFYNSLCSGSDRRVRSGDQVLLVYINHPDSKYIGIPLDAEVLPDWLDDIIIDYKMNWEKADNKITNYLKAIEFDLETVNVNHKKDLFGL